MNEIKFSGNLTFEDHKMIYKILNKNEFFSFEGKLVIALLSLSTVILAFFIMGLVEALFFISTIVIFFGGMAWWYYNQLQKSWKTEYNKQNEHRNGVLTSNLIHICKGENSGEFQWNFFESHFETDEIMTVVKGNEFLSFAHYMFDSQSEWSKAKRLIQKTL